MGQNSVLCVLILIASTVLTSFYFTSSFQRYHIDWIQQRVGGWSFAGTITNISNSFGEKTTEENDEKDGAKKKALEAAMEAEAGGHSFCVSWDVNMDDWWTHHPDWVDMDENETSYCFAKYVDRSRSDLLSSIYKTQWNNNCSNVVIGFMISSGWGADFSHLVQGLLAAHTEGRPFQVGKRHAGSHWHYTNVGGEKLVCPKKDISCYFLPITDCQPLNNTEPLKSRPRRNRARELAAVSYASRPQHWLRRRIYDFMQSNGPHVKTPCIAMHVRRADVVLHGKHSRRYYAIREYLDAVPDLQPGSNILLLTDDANALDEAHEFHPEYNWMYVNKTRHRGSSGGFENQLPSKDPILEVVAILSEFKLVKQCDTLVHTQSGFAFSLYEAMISTGRNIKRIQFDQGVRRHSTENKASAKQLAEQLEEERRRRQQNETLSKQAG